MEDFSKPKIIYQELSQGSSFALDKEGKYIPSNTAYLITGNNLEYLIKMLNSPIIEFVYRTFYATMLGTSGLRWLAQHINNLPIPQYCGTKIQEKILSNDYDEIVNVAEILGLSTEEVSFIVKR